MNPKMSNILQYKLLRLLNYGLQLQKLQKNINKGNPNHLFLSLANYTLYN